MEKEKYVLLLLESSLETLPGKLIKTKKAKALSKRYGIPPKFLLLDVSVFHREMKRFGISMNRGRPDIVHQFLLATQYSPLNLKGKLKVYVHTRNGNIIDVREDARIPKNYFQFVGLIQQLFMKGTVPSPSYPLLSLKQGMNLEDFLKDIGVEMLVLLHEKGRDLPKNELKKYKFPPYAFGIGGFPRGDFSSKVFSISREKVAFYEGMKLDAWIVTSRLLCFLENLS
ncbi:MAG: hypothetical protein QXS56_00220 [Fervidicoccaceae archaeon]